MTLDEFRKKYIELDVRRIKLNDELIEPVRSAILAMKDAGLVNQAGRLNEILFQIDANKEEAHQLMEEGGSDLLFEMIKNIK